MYRNYSDKYMYPNTKYIHRSAVAVVAGIVYKLVCSGNEQIFFLKRVGVVDLHELFDSIVQISIAQNKSVSSMLQVVFVYT